MTKIIFTLAGQPNLLVEREYKKIGNHGNENRYDQSLIDLIFDCKKHKFEKSFQHSKHATLEVTVTVTKKTTMLK